MRCLCPITDLEIHTFAFAPIDSRMYLLLNGSDKAVIIDPNVSTDADRLLMSRGISNVAIFLTHEHYDHISGVNHIREWFSATVTASTRCAEAIRNPGKNLSRYYSSLFCMQPEEIRRTIKDMGVWTYACDADTTFDGAYVFEFGSHMISVVEAPGHSYGSVLISIQSHCLFSGDSLLRFPVVTRLPGGSGQDYARVTKPLLEALSPEIIVYPGHGDVGNLQEMYMEV